MLLTEKEAKTDYRQNSFFRQSRRRESSASAATNFRICVLPQRIFDERSATENRGANVTVWIEGKRGSSSPTIWTTRALRAMVEQAEQLARLAPVDREYLPTLKAQTYKPSGGYVEATANPFSDRARQSRRRHFGECEKSGVIGAGFHQARAERGAFATKNGNFGSSAVGRQLSSRRARRTARVPAIFSRSHFDVNRLDTMRIAREAIRKTLEGRNARTLEPGIYTVILEPQAVADLFGSLSFGFDARSADEGRSPYSAPGGKTRLGEKIFDERISIYSDPWNAEFPARNRRRAAFRRRKFIWSKTECWKILIYSRFWAQNKNERADARTGQHDYGNERKTGDDGRNDRFDKARFDHQPFLVYPLDRPAHGELDRIDARRRVVRRKRKNSISGEKFPL
jgi:hypothetical protein